MWVCSEVDTLGSFLVPLAGEAEFFLWTLQVGSCVSSTRKSCVLCSST
ncbi:hypothetical protein NHE_0798 [Neorickettsia helminthoeca str. Oregon]|uniref:Uncharacterized protein n=1 Tax=Neorickettsia helminthoeca str. Oregon TaxID=1286528 RepID=X5H4T7_9RICK|nr:hypothetical protein NHE_0798 [Neorickettsia helminthoeca str. Oregon]